MRNTIILLLIVAFGINNTKAVDYTPSRIPFYILNAATAYKIDVNLMYAICITESKCKANALNRDDGTPAEKAQGIKVKSYGLFQIKSETAHSLGFVNKKTVHVVKMYKHHKLALITVVDLSDELLKPEVNSLYAAKLLHKLYGKYHSTDRVISAFNAGRPVKCNSDYVLKVLKAYAKLTIDSRR